MSKISLLVQPSPHTSDNHTMGVKKPAQNNVAAAAPALPQTTAMAQPMITFSGCIYNNVHLYSPNTNERGMLSLSEK